MKREEAMALFKQKVPIYKVNRSKKEDIRVQEDKAQVRHNPDRFPTPRTRRKKSKQQVQQAFFLLTSTQKQDWYWSFNKEDFSDYNCRVIKPKRSFTRVRKVWSRPSPTETGLFKEGQLSEEQELQPRELQAPGVYIHRLGQQQTHSILLFGATAKNYKPKNKNTAE